MGFQRSDQLESQNTVLVRLSQSRNTCLSQDVALGELSRFQSDVRIADTRVRGRDVLVHDVQVIHGRLESILESAELRAVGAEYVERAVQFVQVRLRVLLSQRADIRDA